MKTTRTQALNLDRARFQPRLWQLAAFFGLTVCGLAQPNITRQPTNQFVSLGATAQFRVSAGSTSPLTFQWRHEDTRVVGATNATLSITNVQVLDAGNYTVVVSDATGSVTSQPALLDVDPTFTKVTAGALATDTGHWHGATWGDYDNDGYPDLFIHQYSPAVRDFIYRNNGDGTFTRLTAPVPQGQILQNGAWGNAWGDYDNDGHLDLFISNNGGKNVLLHNRGDGTFAKVTAGPGAEGIDSTGPVWGDYDRDGYLDLFVANGYVGQSAVRHWLYHNHGDGTFLKMTTNEVGSLASDRVAATFGCWVDYNSDGWPDLFLPTSSAKSWFYCNQGDGDFVRSTNGVSLSTVGFAWADYDNDGDLDLCLGTWGGPLILYRNEGDGTFKKMTAAEVGSLVTDQTWGGGVAWGDYDNDGFLDLFVAGGWSNASAGVAITKNSFLYHNNGDGTFTRIITGSPANDAGETMGAYWVDYDQDGFLDLFVQDHAGGSAAPNHLYRNNGATNAWLTVKCVGTSSPRFGTGAKVRAYATSCGRPLWQLRLIDAGGTCWGGQSFEANFGLGDALVVDTLRIEWPSGLVQELHNIPAKQILTVTEPPRLIQVVRTNPTQIQLAVKSWTGFQYRVEASSDLVHWEGLGLVTNLNGTIEIDDPQASSSPHRFYRLALPRTETVATFVPPAFPEGIAADRQGNVYVSVVPTGEIRRIAPDGTQSAFAQVPATSLAAGLTLDGDGNLYVAVAPMPPDPAKHGVWKVTPNGTASLFAALPPESLPNDVAFDAHGTLFVTDSIGGKIFHIDAQGQTSEWVVTPLLLGPPNPQPPHPPFPIGANGLAFAGTNVFVCNSDLGTIVQVPVNPDGTAGTSEVFADDPRLFGPDGIKADAQGNLYVASVVQNLILRVSPQKNIEVLADVADGLDSPSSLCFGATATQRTSLFVVNYALVSAMTPGGTPRPGIVRIEVGFVGR